LVAAGWVFNGTIYRDKVVGVFVRFRARCIHIAQVYQTEQFCHSRCDYILLICNHVIDYPENGAVTVLLQAVVAWN
jgi:hypothetical protein